MIIKLSSTEDLIEDEELFPDDALSNHTDMADNEPVVNETKRQFIRYPKRTGHRWSCILPAAIIIICSTLYSMSSKALMNQGLSLN